MPKREHDETLPDDARLIRILVRDDWITNKGGRERAASFVFLDGRTHEVSCYLDSQEARASLRTKFPGMRVGVITVRAAKESGHIVARDEEGGDGIPGHVVLVQVQVKEESKDHIKRTRQLASTSSVEPL